MQDAAKALSLARPLPPLSLFSNPNCLREDVALLALYNHNPSPAKTSASPPSASSNSASSKMSFLQIVKTEVISAKLHENVNQGSVDLMPYAVLWIIPRNEFQTNADTTGGLSPRWNQTLFLPLPPGIAVDDAILHVEIVHRMPQNNIVLIGSAKLRLDDVLVENSCGRRAPWWSLTLEDASGASQGTVKIKVAVKKMFPGTCLGVLGGCGHSVLSLLRQGLRNFRKPPPNTQTKTEIDLAHKDDGKDEGDGNDGDGDEN